jgi:uncharacterized circularly permuted ATP-grasp superfamily protein
LIADITAAPAWRQISAGLDQRARLLELIAADTYQSQTLIRQGLLSPDAVYGHPGYLRPMHGVMSALGQQHLQMIAFNLIQAPDQSWAVVSQSTQAPAGLGQLQHQHDQDYENVGVMLQFLAALRAASPAGNHAAAAVLTSGPFNPLYIEHAQIAAQLGLPLVQGFNLLAKDQQIFLKSNAGLTRIDILLKQMDDDFLDPLEFRADSLLGVPGLMQAIRAGHLIMANAPGAGFLESVQLSASLDSICKALLDEPLQLPNATYPPDTQPTPHTPRLTHAQDTMLVQRVLALRCGHDRWAMLPAGQIRIDC